MVQNGYCTSVLSVLKMTTYIDCEYKHFASEFANEFSEWIMCGTDSWSACYCLCLCVFFPRIFQNRNINLAAERSTWQNETMYKKEWETNGTSERIGKRADKGQQKRVNF